MIKKLIPAIAVALSCVMLSATMCSAKDEKTKIYVDAGHGCMFHSSSEEGPYGFTTTGASGEALYVGGFANHLINSFNHTDRYEAVGISALTHPDGTQGSRELFGNSGRRELFINSDQDIMIQIHHDASGRSTDTGAHVIYSHNSNGSALLARCIARRMEENGIRMLDRLEDHISERHELSLYQAPTNKPMILIEVGFGKEGQLDHDYIREKPIKRLYYKSIIEGCDDYLALTEQEG